MPRWFLVVNGSALLLMGISLLFIRLRERPFYRHFMGIVWAIVCCLAGLGLLLMAKGFVPQPGFAPPGKTVKELPRRPGDVEFPSGR